MAVTAGNLGADGVVHREMRAPGKKIIANSLVPGGAFRGLGEYLHRLGQVQVAFGNRLLQHGQVFHHKGVASRLAKKAENLRVAHPAEDYNAAGPANPGISLTYAFL